MTNTPAAIVILGSANADYSLRVPAIPAPGETLTGTDFRVAQGGKGANQAVACARLGGHAAFIACVGDDGAGRDALTAYANAGLVTDHVHTTEGLATGSAVIFVADSGENCIGIAAGANAALSRARVDASAATVAAAEILLMQLEAPLDTVVYAAALARAHQTRVVLNPAPAQTLDPSLLTHVDILTPNETELAILTGQPVASRTDIVAAAQALKQQGPSTVIVTLGSAGAALVTDDTVTVIDAPVVDASDTTAAGDTFNGALVVALAEGQTLAAAVHFANRAAALSVTRRGAIDAIPTRVEVDAFS
ncbi:MAG: ribokinase [Pseudomonadota bacterium]